MVLVCGHNCAWQLTYRFDTVTRGAVNRVREVHRSAAGKGVNVARVLAALEAPAMLLAYLGGPNGARVRHALDREGIAAKVIDTAADTRTCVTLLESGPPRDPAHDAHRRTGGAGRPAPSRQPAGSRREGAGHEGRSTGPAGWPPLPDEGPAGAETASGAAGEAQQVTELVEPAVTASEAEQARFAAAYERLLEQASAVVIAGTAIGGAGSDVYAEMVRRAHRRGVLTLLDAYHGHARVALAEAPAIVKINRTELAALAGTAVDTEPARIAAYRGLCDRYGVRWVMVSAGAEGIEACDGTRLLRAAAPAVPVVNSIGSGDAASAGVAAALIATTAFPATGVSAGPKAALGAEPAALCLDQADLTGAVRYAVACGSANCLTATPGSVTREAILELHAQVTVTETPV